MKLKLGILAIILSLTLAGCSNQETTTDNSSNGNQIKENDNTKVESNEQEKQEGQEKAEEPKEPEKQDNQGKQEESEKTENQGKSVEKIDNVDLKIYTIDVEDSEKVLEFGKVTVDKNASIEDKLKVLCEALQNDYFKDDYAKIVFVSIDKDNIATINLDNKDAWHDYFQGSTGGYISQMTIINTLLQREYSGEWINGVNVLIDGEKQEIFDHAPFEEIFYR